MNGPKLFHLKNIKSISYKEYVKTYRKQLPSEKIKEYDKEHMKKEKLIYEKIVNNINTLKI